jgi:type VI protein secretion system component VasK
MLWAAGIFGSIIGMIFLVWLTYSVWNWCVNARKSTYQKLEEDREIEAQQIQDDKLEIDEGAYLVGYNL